MFNVIGKEFGMEYGLICSLRRLLCAMGHGPGGLIGITLNENAVRRWALSLHICSRLIKDMADLKESSSIDVTTHKEEMVSRIRNDNMDRKVISDRLSQCIDPMDAANHPPGLVNIVSGRICTDGVNVDNAVTISKTHMQEYEASLPGGFNQPLKNRIRTMEEGKNKARTWSVEQFESGLIFARVMALMNSRNVDVKDIFSYELASVPTSMFKERNRALRIAKSKSILKQKLQVEQSSRVIAQPVAIVIDGCAILWTVHWPCKCSVNDLVTNFMNYVTGKLKDSVKVHIIFDRYYEYSIKSGTRCSRTNHVSREHQLHLNSPLPPQNVALTAPRNKTQLIDMICEELISSVKQFNMPNSLVITGRTPIHIEVYNGLIIQRQDLKSVHEEADVMISHQVVALANLGCDRIKVISHDTDVLVLLVYYYEKKKLTTTLIMEPTSQGRSSVNIGATVAKHRDIALHVLPAHALTDCDTVACYYGIGKNKMVKVLEAGKKLNNLGDLSAKIESVFQESTAFIAACYGQKCENGETMSDIRYKVWVSKTRRKGACLLPKLKSLPPTTAAFQENAKRAHFETCIWMAALDGEPPNLDPVKFWWEKDELTKSLDAVTLPQDVYVAPASVLKMIQCTCSSDQPCSSLRCGCAATQLACSVFCKCRGSDSCLNQ